ncbi:MAG: site-specific DNA-methyltransferase [Clostridia bacterium]|nr:site-specific DNA-methyltransferase [Clostridia bacterium]
MIEIDGIIEKGGITVNRTISAFKNYINIDWTPSDAILSDCKALLDYSEENGYARSDFNQAIREAINQKLDLGKPIYQHILNVAFEEKILLNYNLKKAIKRCVTAADPQAYKITLEDHGISNIRLQEAFDVIEIQQTKDAIKEVMENDKKSEEVLTAIFVRSFYMTFDEKCRDLFFSGQSEWDEKYEDLLNRLYPEFTKRTLSLAFIEVDSKRFDKSYEQGCNYYFNVIRHYYNALDNHCDLILTIPTMRSDDGDLQWRLYSDLIIFAEKHCYHDIDRMYFRKKKIRAATEDYIQPIDSEKANFDLAAEGFVFKDCYVVDVSEREGYDLVIVFEKNIRDERLINCPECRSTKIQGNSYPILNVRSWECDNPLCPDRSKYNRGKRYAFVSYMRQKAMEDDRNNISTESIAKWHLDCLSVQTFEEIFDMACTHYCFAYDKVAVISEALNLPVEYKYRTINFDAVIEQDDSLFKWFKDSPYFWRYNYDNPDNDNPNAFTKHQISENAVLFQGDSRIVLKSLEEGSISAGVTSPPYYNAKDYSQWSNIYCYLYDMRNIAREVLRVLKPGGVFLYNIFDYFDNENNIALSAMGDKRMILGAYTIDLFERIGFTIQGDIIWNKGEIQGNRSFNQGNTTPYYQAPLNCWEHVLVFSKGNMDEKYASLKSSIEKIRPYIKYVRGKNVLGHDAPFPEEIPDLLIKYLEPDDVILDPFSGSYTTGIAAYRKGIKSICIEKSPEYVELSIKRFKERSYNKLEIEI